MFSSLLLSTALATPTMPPCGTLQQLPVAPAVNVRDPNAPAVLAVAGTKLVRNPNGTPNARVSDNFAVHYGGSGGVTDSEVTRLLDAFELAWQVQIETLDSARPFGTDEYLFNVYIGDSDDGAPSSLGNAGYYTVDAEGWPIIVVSASSLDQGDLADHIASHEFYHAIQGATQRFPFFGLGAWYWEATAEWAALETIPENLTNGTFVFAYLLLPQVPVNFFGYPDPFAELNQFYQYGAFLFPHYLTEVTGNRNLIGDSWSDPSGVSDPLEVLRALLADDGHDLDELWLDHLAANVVYDYTLGAVWQQQVDYYATEYSEDERAVLEYHSGPGSEGDVEVRSARAPLRYGYNVIHLSDPDPGDLTVTIKMDRTGTFDSPTLAGARLVRVDGGVATPLDVPFDGRKGELWVEDIGSADEAWLVVGAWTETTDNWQEQAYPYTYALSVAEPEPTTTPSELTEPTQGSEPAATPSPEVSSGVACGCAAAPDTPPWAMGLRALARRR